MTGFALLFFSLSLGILAIWVAYVDARHGVIRNYQNLALLISGLLSGAALHGQWLEPLIGACFGLATLLTIQCLYRVRRGRDGIGYGDVKFMAGAGAWVQWSGVAPVLVLASVLAVTVVLIGGAFRISSLSRQERVRFGPYLAAATFAVFLAQEFGSPPWIQS